MENEQKKQLIYQFLGDFYNENIRLSEAMEGRLERLIQVSGVLAIIGAGFISVFIGKLNGNNIEVNRIIIIVGFSGFILLCILSIFIGLLATLKSFASTDPEFKFIKEIPVEGTIDEFKKVTLEKYTDSPFNKGIERRLHNTYLKIKLINYKNRQTYKVLYCLIGAFIILGLCISIILIKTFLV